ncbi:hypothetical protein CXB51_034202 [Gossypium anomalum]|uniref:Uncharacterized protein n=1 Tax=Gossypium anomalum TaxID=47600 RepID=A0A8J5Y0Y9_9ROSI|nr:hypothetical protein CXB51_034202 [Gossypium anomalum]
MPNGKEDNKPMMMLDIVMQGAAPIIAELPLPALSPVTVGNQNGFYSLEKQMRSSIGCYLFASCYMCCCGYLRSTRRDKEELLVPYVSEVRWIVEWDAGERRAARGLKQQL